MNLLSSITNLDTKYSFVQALQRAAVNYRDSCASLRSKIFARLHELSFTRSQSGPVALSNTEEYEKRSSFLSAMHETSTIPLLPSTRPTDTSAPTMLMSPGGTLGDGKKQAALERNHSLNMQIEEDASLLSSTCIVEIQMVVRIGNLVRGTVNTLKASNILQSCTWLMIMFDDFHRGVRHAVRLALISIAQSRCRPYLPPPPSSTAPAPPPPSSSTTSRSQPPPPASSPKAASTATAVTPSVGSPLLVGEDDVTSYFQKVSRYHSKNSLFSAICPDEI
jgi:hypothetical protein